jgi:hypothetical protein
MIPGYDASMTLSSPGAQKAARGTDGEALAAAGQAIQSGLVVGDLVGQIGRHRAAGLAEPVASAGFTPLAVSAISR